MTRVGSGLSRTPVGMTSTKVALDLLRALADGDRFAEAIEVFDVAAGDRRPRESVRH